jgi:alpha-beta hydrolase superfamily lysophospholipase
VALAPPRGVVVTVCGLGDSTGTWTRLHRALLDEGLGVVPVVWQPVGASLDGLAAQVAAAASEGQRQAGGAPLHLVGHSTGGVAARRAVQRGALHGRVGSVTTVASPHGAAPLARLARPVGRWLPLAAELDRRPGALDAVDRDPAGARWTALVVADDLIVPPESQAMDAIPGAAVRLPGSDHLAALRADCTIATVRAPVTADALAA